jgi:iron only hydrogenase large subunit-like protein
VIDNYCNPITQTQVGSMVSFVLSSGKPTTAPTSMPLAKPSKGPTSAPLAKPSKKPTAKPVVQAVCPAVSYDLQKSVTINTTATGYKVNVKRIVGNGLGNKIVLDGYASKPIVTQGMTGSAMSFAISSGALCNAPPPTIKPTAKPVVQQSSVKPTAKPVVQAVCPAVSYDLQKSVTINTTATGYKVNVKRIVGNGLGNKIVLDGYASKPIVTQGMTGSAMSFAISSGALCNAPPPTIKPTAKPVGQAVCPAVSYDLQKSVTISTTATGYKVNVKRIVGNGLGNKIVLDGYASKPIVTQGTTGSAMSFAISSGALCNAPPPTIKPTAKPVVQAVCPAVSYDLQKSVTISTTATGYKVNVKRIVGNGLGNKIVLDGYASKPIITQSTTGSAMSFAISSGALCNAPPPSIKPTAKPVVKQSSVKPTAKPVGQAVCPAVSYDLQKSVTMTTGVFTGYKVNVKRIVGNGLGNKIVLDGYASKPIITQGTTGSAMSFAISSGALCNAPPSTIRPTAKPVVQQSSVKPTAKPVGQAVCPAVSYDLQKSVTISTTITGYKVNVKRIVGKGVGNKIVLDGYASKPIVTQGMVGSTVSLAISSGSLCNAPGQTFAPTARPVGQAVCPSIPLELPTIGKWTFSMTGYKVNVIRTIGKGVVRTLRVPQYFCK